MALLDILALLAIPVFLQFFPERLGGASILLSSNPTETAAPRTHALQPCITTKKSSRRLEKGFPWPPLKDSTSDSFSL